MTPDLCAQTATSPIASPPIAEIGITTARRRVFPGEDAQVSAVRRWLLEQLPGGTEHPAAWEVATLGSELATNAIRHTRSGRPGGTFCVAVDFASQPFLWLGVYDQGGVGAPRPAAAPDPAAESGRGLQMLDAVALSWGTIRTPGQGRLVWCTIAAALAEPGT